MPHSKTQNDFTKDVVYLLENWKTFPVVNTEVLVDTFPFVLPPLDHFKEVVKRVKNKEDTHEQCNYNETHKHSHRESTHHCDHHSEKHHSTNDHSHHDLHNHDVSDSFPTSYLHNHDGSKYNNTSTSDDDGHDLHYHNTQSPVWEDAEWDGE